jgi:hypothetical protein
VASRTRSSSSTAALAAPWIDEDVDVVCRQPAEAAFDGGDDGSGVSRGGDVELRPDIEVVAADLLEELSDPALAVAVLVVVRGVDVVDAPVDDGPQEEGSGSGLPPSDISDTSRPVRPSLR